VGSGLSPRARLLPAIAAGSWAPLQASPSWHRRRAGPAGLGCAGAGGRTCEGPGGLRRLCPPPRHARWPSIAVKWRLFNKKANPPQNLGARRRGSIARTPTRGRRLCRGWGGSSRAGCTAVPGGTGTRGQEEVGEAAAAAVLGAGAGWDFAAVTPAESGTRACVRVRARAGGIISSYSSTSHSKCFLKASIH